MDTPVGTLNRGIPPELERKFARMRVRIHALSAAKGLALVVFTALAAFAVAVVVDRVFWLQMPFRLLILCATLAALAVCLVANLVLPLLRRYTAAHLALAVEERHPELGDIVVSTVELSESRAAGRLTASSQLVDALTCEALGRTRNVSFGSVAPLRAIRWALVLAIVLAAVVGAYCVAEPPVARNVLLRILNPTADIEPFTYTTVEVSPGSCAVPKGSDVELVATASGRVPARAGLAWRTGRARWRRLKLALRGDDTCRYTFKNVLRPITYRLRAGDARTGAFSIIPVEPPAIVDFEMTYEYPDYTGIGTQPGPSRTGNIQALRGTRVRLTATATKPVEAAWVTFEFSSDTPEGDDDDGDAGRETDDEPETGPDVASERRELNVDGTLVGPLTIEVKEKASYTLHLRDKHGFTNPKPVAYSIVPLPDREPEIDIVAPDAAIKCTPDMGVPIRFSARDDFGLTAMRLVYRGTSGEPMEEKDRIPEDEFAGELPIELPRHSLTELAAEYFLDLSTLNLQPGMVLTFRLEATDNDAIDGPKTGRSIERTVTIISDQDAFKRVEEEQQALQRRLRTLIRQQEVNKKLTEQLEQELATAHELPIEKAEQLEEARRAQDTIAESTKELASDFDPTIDKMQENPLIQPQSVLRMQEMKHTLAELARSEMARASAQLRSARDAGQPSERASRLGSAAQTEEEILRALRRIDDQFDRLQDEQRLLSLAGSARNMARQQNRNLDATREAARDFMGKAREQLTDDQERRLKKLVDREQKLREKLEEFEEEMERAQRQLQYRRSEDAAMVEQTLEQLRQSRLAQAMEQAKQDLQANHLSKSVNPQQKAADSLWQMVNQLEQAQRAKLAPEFENTEEAMQAHISEIDRLIELENQIIAATEQLASAEGGEGAGGDAVARLLERYGAIEESQRRTHERAQSFSDLLAEIFSQLVMPGIDPVTPTRAAVNSMGDAVERLSHLQRADALADERRALEALLTARDALAQALAKLMAESMMAMMQQRIDKLAEIIEKQRTINDDTKETDTERPRSGELTAALRRLIERLANRQGRLGDEVVELGELVEVLRSIGERMGMVAGMLRELRTGKETQEEQEKILAELEQLMFNLQAQLDSMMQAMGLASVPGGGGGGNRGGLDSLPRLRELPGGPAAELDLPDRLRRELLQAWNEKYPESFRELLSLYYRRLSEEENPY